MNCSIHKKQIQLQLLWRIKNIPLFATLSERELQKVTHCVCPVEYKKGEMIYAQGNMSDAFYIILSGRCRMFVSDGKGEGRTIAYLHKNDYFGEVALLTDKVHATNNEVVNDMLLLKIEKEYFLQLMNTILSFSMQISRRLGMRVKKLYDIGSKKVGTKIISLVQISDPAHNICFANNVTASLRVESQEPVLFIDICSCGVIDAVFDDTPINKITSEEFSHVGQMSLVNVKPYVITNRSGVDIIPIDKICSFQNN